jgi:hypothetical protein
LVRFVIEDGFDFDRSWFDLWLQQWSQLRPVIVKRSWVWILVVQFAMEASSNCDWSWFDLLLKLVPIVIEDGSNCDWSYFDLWLKQWSQLRSVVVSKPDYEKQEARIIEVVAHPVIGSTMHAFGSIAFTSSFYCSMRNFHQRKYITKLPVEHSQSNMYSMDHEVVVFQYVLDRSSPDSFLRFILLPTRTAIRFWTIFCALTCLCRTFHW